MSMTDTSSPAGPPVIVLVSTFADYSGGEAIRALQFFERVSEVWPKVYLITHERSRPDLEASPLFGNVRFVRDDRLQWLFWKSKVLQGLNIPYFHWQTRALIRAICPPGSGHIVHYVCPISPVAPRFPPKGYRLIIGPLNGNIAYPPAFAAREGWRARLRHRLHGLTQRLLYVVFNEKARYETVLVSGHERTLISLDAAGVDRARCVHVADVGVPDQWRARPRITHRGMNGRFMTASRLVDLKAIDLAIKAVVRAGPEIRLDVFGDGPSLVGWQTLARTLGVSDRVTFHGWCAHEEVLGCMQDYRGFVFPTLAEANGNVMQEAMLAGLPVIALRWGGPAHLAGDDSALYIEPGSEEQIIADIAEAMSRLAHQPETAEAISRTARTIAERDFTWETVFADWTRPYGLSDTAPAVKTDTP